MNLWAVLFGAVCGGLVVGGLLYFAIVVINGSRRRRLYDPERGEYGAGPYNHLVAEMHAQAEARMISAPEIDEWSEIDIAEASTEDLIERHQENGIVRATEYPETEHGTYRAMREDEMIEEELRRRGHGEVIEEHHKRSMRAAVAAHGGPLPEWAK